MNRSAVPPAGPLRRGKAFGLGMLKRRKRRAPFRSFRERKNLECLTRVATMNRSRRRESAQTLWQKARANGEETGMGLASPRKRWRGLTSAATRFLEREQPAEPSGRDPGLVERVQKNVHGRLFVRSRDLEDRHASLPWGRHDGGLDPFGLQSQQEVVGQGRATEEHLESGFGWAGLGRNPLETLKPCQNVRPGNWPRRPAAIEPRTRITRAHGSVPGFESRHVTLHHARFIVPQAFRL
jgi:hypothetical protein